jgi:hypothetical protein
MHLEAGAIGLREAISQGFVSGMRKVKNELMQKFSCYKNTLFLGVAR